MAGLNKKNMFISALRTLMFSWGGDTPNEAVWAGNELLDWYDAEYGTHTKRFMECEDKDDLDFNNVIKSL